MIVSVVNDVLSTIDVYVYMIVSVVNDVLSTIDGVCVEGFTCI